MYVQLIWNWVVEYTHWFQFLPHQNNRNTMQKLKHTNNNNTIQHNFFKLILIPQSHRVYTTLDQPHPSSLAPLELSPASPVTSSPTSPSTSFPAPPESSIYLLQLTWLIYCYGPKCNFKLTPFSRPWTRPWCSSDPITSTKMSWRSRGTKIPTLDFSTSTSYNT